MSEKTGTEREFLHDISSPLGGLQLHLEALTGEAKLDPKIDPEHFRRLEKCLSLLEKANAILVARKAKLVAEGA